MIFEELRALLRDDVSDPALGPVRILAVVLSVDYRHARVHFAIAGTAEVAEKSRHDVERGLARATAFLRARLADAIDLKRTPDLRFVLDGEAPLEAEGGPSWSD